MKKTSKRVISFILALLMIFSTIQVHERKDKVVHATTNYAGSVSSVSFATSFGSGSGNNNLYSFGYVIYMAPSDVLTDENGNTTMIKPTKSDELAWQYSSSSWSGGPGTSSSNAYILNTSISSSRKKMNKYRDSGIWVYDNVHNMNSQATDLVHYGSTGVYDVTRTDMDDVFSTGGNYFTKMSTVHNSAYITEAVKYFQDTLKIKDSTDYNKHEKKLRDLFYKKGYIATKSDALKKKWLSDMQLGNTVIVIEPVFVEQYDASYNGYGKKFAGLVTVEAFQAAYHRRNSSADSKACYEAERTKISIEGDIVLYSTAKNHADLSVDGTHTDIAMIYWNALNMYQETYDTKKVKHEGASRGWILWGNMKGGSNSPVLVDLLQTKDFQVGIANQTIDKTKIAKTNKNYVKWNNNENKFSDKAYTSDELVSGLDVLSDDYKNPVFLTVQSSNWYLGSKTNEVTALGFNNNSSSYDYNDTNIPLHHLNTKFGKGSTFTTVPKEVAYAHGDTNGQHQRVGYYYKITTPAASITKYNSRNNDFYVPVNAIKVADAWADKTGNSWVKSDDYLTQSTTSYMFANGAEARKYLRTTQVEDLINKVRNEDNGWSFNTDAGVFVSDNDVQSAIGYVSGYVFSIPKVKSTVYEYTIDLDNGTVTENSKDTNEYYAMTLGTPDGYTKPNVKTTGDYKLSKKTTKYVAIPKIYDNASTHTAVKNALTGKTDVLEIGAMLTQSSDTYIFKGNANAEYYTCKPSTQIKIGAKSDMATLAAKGYNIYAFAIKQDKLKMSVDISLPDEDLNKVYQSIVADAFYPKDADGTHYSPLVVKGASYYDYHEYSWVTCSLDATHQFKDWSYKKYGAEIKETSTVVTNGVVDRDNKNARQGQLLANSLMSGGLTQYTRAQYKAKVTTTSNTRIEYAYNLSRYATKDKRVLSALTRTTTMQHDWADSQGAKFGVVPSTDTDSVNSGLAKRDSNTKLTDKYTETLKWTTYNTWNHTHDFQTLNPVITTHTCSKQDDAGNWYYGVAYYRTRGEVVADEFAPIDVAGINFYEFELTVNQTFFKYITDKINNDKPGTNGESRQVNDLAVRASELGAANYRMAYIQNFTDSEDRTTVKNNDAGGILLTYYPEVAMRNYLYKNVKDADSDGKVDTVSARSDIAPSIINTIGEYKRKTYANSLYVFRLRDTDSNNENNVTGKIFSDDMSTGTQSDKSNNLPTIYSGSNITINADCVFTADAYGYALDMVSYEDDKDGFVTQIKTDALAEVKLPYSSVIQGKESNGTPINPMKYYQPDNLLANGKSKSKANLYKDYKNWVSELTNAGYWGADMTLKINRGSNDEVFNNFSTSVGSIKFTPANQKENGAYPIVVKHGVVVKDGDDAAGYKALIKQISADFTCTEDQAEQLFEKSGMYKAIVNSIESDISDENKSDIDELYTLYHKNAKTFADETGKAYEYANGNLLGTNKHWYDESVRIFCIRRYETTGIKISGIMCNDKIDYSSAAQQNTQDTVNNSQAKYNNVRGKWYLTLYFKKGQGASATKSVRGIDPANEYDPKVYTGLGTARGNGDVVLSESYVQQCDFLIPNASTSDTDD